MKARAPMAWTHHRLRWAFHAAAVLIPAAPTREARPTPRGDHSSAKVVPSTYMRRPSAMKPVIPTMTRRLRNSQSPNTMWPREKPLGTASSSYWSRGALRKALRAIIIPSPTRKRMPKMSRMKEYAR